MVKSGGRRREARRMEEEGEGREGGGKEKTLEKVWSGMEMSLKNIQERMN